MPELPEAETIARALDAHLQGQRITNTLAAGQRLERVARHGKIVLFEFERDRLQVRLGMTGALLLHDRPDAYVRDELRFESATVRYSDIRRFGRLLWNQPLRVGPDIWTMATEQFASLLATRKRQIKPLLLDQSFVAGLGNIYVDELLYRARVHPLQIASGVEGVALHREAVSLLNEAVAAGGSTISDFRDPWDRSGTFQLHHQAYGKTGQPCRRCGTILVRLLVGQRGTHLCPRCQRLRGAH